jgi:hypothetical protein
MNAIATLIFLFSVITIFLSQWLTTRGQTATPFPQEGITH